MFESFHCAVALKSNANTTTDYPDAWKLFELHPSPVKRRTGNKEVVEVQDHHATARKLVSFGHHRGN